MASPGKGPGQSMHERSRNHLCICLFSLLCPPSFTAHSVLANLLAEPTPALLGLDISLPPPPTQCLPAQARKKPADQVGVVLPPEWCPESGPCCICIANAASGTPGPSCPGPRAEEFGRNRGRGPSTLNSRCPHTQTGRVLGGQSKVKVREKTEGWRCASWAYLRFLGVSGRSPGCAGSHVCSHLCPACPSIPRVSVSTCPISCPLSLYLGTVVLDGSPAGPSAGLSLPPPEPLHSLLPHSQALLIPQGDS